MKMKRYGMIVVAALFVTLIVPACRMAGAETEAGVVGFPAGLSIERVSVDEVGTGGNLDSEFPSMSADGRFVAFSTAASNLVAGDTNGESDVFVYDRENGSIERVSLSSGGDQGNSFSQIPSISADGRYMAFESAATNLVADDTNSAWDVFVRDRQNGTTERVSVNSVGDEGNDGGGRPAISADGRYVAFYSSSTNLVAADTNSAADIFVHDRQSGTTERVSVDSSGAEANYGSYLPKISADGRYVAFVSDATNLVADDVASWTDIFVHDRQSGATERVSVNSSEEEAVGNSSSPAISGDGRYVAFDSYAANLVGSDTNSNRDIFVRDRQNGTTERVSVHSDGSEATGGASQAPAISADGRLVLFQSAATTLISGDTNFAPDIFVHDGQSGVTARVNVDAAGVAGNATCHYASAISSDGRYAAFASPADNLTAGDVNGVQDIFAAPVP